MNFVKQVSSRTYVMFTLVAVFALGGLLYVPASAKAAQDNGIETLRSLSAAFSSIAEKTTPAVVGIKAERTVKGQTSPQLPGQEDMFEFFFRRRSPGQGRQFQQTAQGSGFIITPDGYVLTNNHLVGEADKVEVELSDQTKYEADIIGTDPESDVAVIKIDAENLPYIELGNSDGLKVGEWVIAIGSPFGLSHTVTAGIVSATGRQGVGLTTYENFIQTDAAINFGNSGGPLINLDGKAVGINSAILGPSGNIGIGFAIPMNMARNIYEQLKETGSVTRGFLGVLPQNVDPEMAEMFGLKDRRGVAIAEVTPDSAASRAGLKHNDIVLAINGKKVETADDFRYRIAKYAPGSEVELTIWRDGDKKKVTAVLDKRPSRDELVRGNTPEPVDVGFSVQNLTNELAEQLGYEGETGVLVGRVESGSDAERAGITPGTLIKEVNREKVANVTEFSNAIKDARKEGKALLLVKREDYTFFVLLPLNEEE